MLYDRAFRRRAEATKNLNWSVVNTSLFNLCFGGRARRKVICQICLSEQHTANTCPKSVLALGQPLLYSASQVLPGEVFAPPPPMYQPNAFRSGAPHTFQPSSRGQSQEICRLFNAKNGNRCRFPQCRFAHVCARCRLGGHGASQYGVGGTDSGPAPKRPRQ